jgi:hypothetical protein
MARTHDAHNMRMNLNLRMRHAGADPGVPARDAAL